MRRQAQPIDRNVMRGMNQNTLLNLIRAHSPISRTQLMEMSGLSFGTVVGIISILIEKQLVVERGTAESTGGRKAGLLEVYPEGGYAIGISLMEDSIAGMILNLHGAVVCTELWPAQLRGNADHAVEVIARGVESFIERCQIPRDKIIGLGCGVSGVVDARKGVSVDSWILNWHNVEIGQPLSQRLAMRVFVENAVDCLISYEKLFGFGKSFRDFLLISLGRGLGFSAVIRDEVYRGGQGEGSEFGHIPYRLPGRTCECGKEGCLEEYIADRGIVQTYNELCLAQNTVDLSLKDLPDYRIVQMIFDRALEGDPLALQTFEQTGTHLGIGVATLVNLFNPECIIFYGGMDRPRMQFLMAPMKAALRQHTFSLLGRDLKLQIEPDIMMMNWARGAGSIVLRHFFAVPTKI